MKAIRLVTWKVSREVRKKFSVLKIENNEFVWFSLRQSASFCCLISVSAITSLAHLLCTDYFHSVLNQFILFHTHYYDRLPYRLPSKLVNYHNRWLLSLKCLHRSSTPECAPAKHSVVFTSTDRLASSSMLIQCSNRISNCISKSIGNMHLFTKLLN